MSQAATLESSVDVASTVADGSSEPLKLVVDSIIFASPPPGGGVERVFRELLPRLCNQDKMLKISLVSQTELRQPLPVHPQITHYGLVQRSGPANVFKPLVSAHFFNVTLRQGRGMIWHSTKQTLPPRWLGKQVFTVHDLIPERFPQLFSQEQLQKTMSERRACLQEADRIICVSETTKQDLIAFHNVDAARIVTIYNGIGSVFHREQIITTSPPTNKPFLLYVGGRSAYKRFDTLLGAYSRWHYRDEIDLVVVGRPFSKNDYDKLRALNIHGHVIQPNHVDDYRLCDLYNESVGFVHTANYEGFGLGVLEAMACGCPVVASRIPTTEEIAGNYPYYFVPQDVESLLDALDRVVDGGRTLAQQEAGIARAKHYTWDATARATLSLYRELNCESA